MARCGGRGLDRRQQQAGRQAGTGRASTCTRKPRLMRSSPASSSQGTRKTICRQVGEAPRGGQADGVVELAGRMCGTAASTARLAASRSPPAPAVPPAASAPALLTWRSGSHTVRKAESSSGRRSNRGCREAATSRTALRYSDWSGSRSRTAANTSRSPSWAMPSRNASSFSCAAGAPFPWFFCGAERGQAVVGARAQVGMC